VVIIFASLFGCSEKNNSVVDKNEIPVNLFGSLDVGKIEQVEIKSIGIDAGGGLSPF
jgi:hypothetical protein